MGRDTSQYPSCQPAKLFEYHLKKKFGLTPEQYRVLFVRCDNKCEICSRPVTMGGQGQGRGSMGTGCVDHNHSTGKVRGILCRICNSFLGVIGERPALLTAYLEDA